MPGPVKQFPDFSVNTNGDTGANSVSSILPINNGESLSAATLDRPSESLRQRTEVIRSIEQDSLYLRDAQQNLIIAGPGTVTWPGSVTSANTGIPTISDVLYIVPGLTPGAAQSSPVPPVASAYGTLSLLRASDSTATLLVTSMRRSYAAGDEINITVTSGASFSCTLSTESTFERTITIVATGSTTMSTVISALNALTPTSPDNTQLVTAALENGGSGSDLILVPQAKQYISGNYDGEGHTLTPANLAGFFVSNPSQALAEGDSLCVQYADVTNLSTTGGRRQAIPENSNTAISAGSLFNSRVHPELLINSLFICKVIDGNLVFGTGSEIGQGATNQPLGNYTAANISYSGGPNWADGTTNPATTVQAQLSKIVSDLAGSSAGASKIEGPTVGTYLTAAPLGAQVATMANFVHSDKAPAETNYVPLRQFNDYQGNVRSLIDHTGYRMGQVSEIDENWRANTVTVHLDPATGYPYGGYFDTSTGAANTDVFVDKGSGQYVVFNSTHSGATWNVPISSAVPLGAIITGIAIIYESLAVNNVMTGALNGNTLNTPGTYQQVTKTITTTAFNSIQTMYLASSPTAGSLPRQYSFDETDYVSVTLATAYNALYIYDIQVTYVVPPTGWTYTQYTGNTIAAGDQVSFNDPSSGMSQRSVTLQTASAGSTTGRSQLVSDYEAWGDANMAYTMEFTLKTGTIDDSYHGCNIDLGLNWGSSDQVTLHWDYSFGTWQVNISADSGQAYTSTSVAVTANTVYQVRLEVCGPNMNSVGGTTWRVRLFINGVLAANALSPTAITADRVQPYLSVYTTVSSAGPYTVTIGRLRRTWNHFQAGYAL